MTLPPLAALFLFPLLLFSSCLLALLYVPAGCASHDAMPTPLPCHMMCNLAHAVALSRSIPACQDKHWRRGHKDFHKSPKTENSVLLLDKKDITATRDYGVRPDPNVPDEGILKRFHDIDINSS